MTNEKFTHFEVERVANRFVIQPECHANFFPYLGVALIHIPKTGGTALSVALAREDYKRQINGFKKIADIPDIPFQRHRKAIELREIMSKKYFETFLRVALVRNPFEVMLSSYKWFQQIAPKTVSGPAANLVAEVNQMSGFDEFCDSRYGREMINFHPGDIWDYLTDTNDKMLVEIIGKLEQNDIMDKISTSTGFKFSTKMPNYNATRHNHYSQYYNDISRTIIEQRFSRELNYFGYAFEQNGFSFH